MKCAARFAPLLLAGGSAWAGLAPPNTVQCAEQFENGSCQTDHGKEGSCISKWIKAPDFSIPGPPVFKDERLKVCVERKSQFSMSDVLGGVGTSLAIFIVGVLAMLRRKIFRSPD